LLTDAGKHYIRQGSNDRYVFLSDGRDLSVEDNERLMRMTAKIWCEGAKDGHLAGMMSTNDVSLHSFRHTIQNDTQGLAFDVDERMRM
jgi:hypothetical protein